MQLLFLLISVLGLTSLLVVFLLLIKNNKQNQQTLLKYQKKYAVNKYESYLLGLIENQIETTFDMEKIANVFIDSLDGSISHNLASYLLIIQNRLVFRGVIVEPVNEKFISDVKSKLLESFGEMNGVSLSAMPLSEQISGQTDEDLDTTLESYFNIPLVISGQLVGVLNVASSEKNLYSVTETLFLYNAINKLLGAVSRVQNITLTEAEVTEKRAKELERRAYQAEILRELNERMGYSLDLAKIVEIITGSVGKLLDYHVIAYMTNDNDVIYFKCDLKEQVNHAFVADVKGKMLEAFSAMLNKELKKDKVDESITGAIFNEEAKSPVSSFFNLPLIIGEKVAGLITVASPKKGLYTEEETAILYTITNQASTAVSKLNDVLEREKGKLNSLVATIDDGIVMIDPHWGLLVINTKARQLLGLPEGELGVFDVLDKLSGKIDIRTKIEKAVAKNETIPPAEITLGEKILQIVILRVQDKDKENLGAVVVFHDITQERKARAVIEEEVKERTKQLREEQTKLKASIDSLNVGFLIVNPAEEIVMINPLAKRLLCSSGYGVIKGGLSNTSCTMAEIEKDFKSVFDLRSNIAQSIKEKKPIQIKNLEYKNHFLHIFISPIVLLEEELKVIGTVVLVEDVTEAKVMERSKDEFFSIASHELRTPLTAIRGNTSMIKEFYMEQLKDSELKGMIDDIHDSSVRLIEIVNDFLDVSRLEQGKIEYKKEPFDANVLSEEVVKELKDLATEKKIYVKIEADSKASLVYADRNKIKQILLNLAGNSVKFTETGGVTIKTLLEGNFVKVKISDTGRGIPLANQKLLFRKFQQAGSSIITRDTTKGTGLGLYISKLMIEGMGGQINLEKSEEGKGSTFTFTIPLATKEQINAQKSTQVAQASTQVNSAASVAAKPQSVPSQTPPVAPKTDKAPVNGVMNKPVAKLPPLQA